MKEEGRIQPQNLDVEEIVLACILLDKNAVYETVGKLKPEHFYAERNAIIYQAVIELNQKTSPVDMITISDHLRKNKTLDQIGGVVALAEISNRINNTRNLPTYVDIVIDCYQQRELIRILSEKIGECYDEEKEGRDIIASLETDMYKLVSQQTRTEPQKLNLHEAVDAIYKFNDHEIIGVPTPFSRLNKLTGGWQKQDLIIIGGRPSQGKSQTAIECILAASESKKPTLFFSCEMSSRAISQRFICHHAKIDNESIRAGLTDEALMNVEYQVGVIEKLPIYLDDTANIELMELVSKAKRAKLKYGIELIVIDYLGLITTEAKFKSEDERIGFITKTIKGLAKTLDIPIILLSQLNRAVEMHGDKRPTLANLRSSGNIEQDADLVLFIHNPQFYKDPDAEENVLELLLAKHRNGKIEDMKIRRASTWYALWDYSY